MLDPGSTDLDAVLDGINDGSDPGAVSEPAAAGASVPAPPPAAPALPVPPPVVAPVSTPATGIPPVTSTPPVSPAASPGNPPAVVPPANPAVNPSQGGSPMTDLASLAALPVGPGRDDKLQNATLALRNVAAIVDQEIPGVSLVISLDGKVISGNMEESIRGLYHYLAGDNGVSLMANDVNLFIGLCVFSYGDNDAVRKAAKSVYEKKGA